MHARVSNSCHRLGPLGLILCTPPTWVLTPVQRNPLDPKAFNRKAGKEGGPSAEHGRTGRFSIAAFTPPKPLERLLSHESATSILTRTGERAHTRHPLGLLEGVRAAPSKAKSYHHLTSPICQAIVAAGGRIANVGVHGKPVELHVERLWDRNITLTTRLVDTVTTPMLLKVVQSGKLQPSKLVTHRFALHDAMKAYDTFANAAAAGALKVILKNDGPRAEKRMTG